jgi:glycosyltransferase involved in cell wall biosynthesis
VFAAVTHHGRTGVDAEAAPTSVTVTVVFPCLDEAESVGACVTEALAALDAVQGGGEVLVVDNGSSDGSAELALAAGARVIYEPERGYGSALRAGIAAATGAIVVMADADLTYPLERIPDLVAPVAAGEADMVLGARLVGANPETMPFLHRYLGTPTITWLTARACGRRVVNDSQSGFRAFNRDRVQALDLRGSGMEFATEMLIRASRAGVRIEEVDTGYRPRVGESKLDTWSDGWRHLQLLLMLAPDLLLITPGALLVTLGVLMLVTSYINPDGIEVGSLLWQPVFFSGIALVLGVQALLAGVLIAHSSSVTSPGVERRFRFVAHPLFRRRCFAAGAGMLILGLALNGLLFLRWLNEDAQGPSDLPLSSLSQSLIIVGGTLASFSVVSHFRLRGET